MSLLAEALRFPSNRLRHLPTPHADEPNITPNNARAAVAPPTFFAKFRRAFPFSCLPVFCAAVLSPSAHRPRLESSHFLGLWMQTRPRQRASARVPLGASQSAFYNSNIWDWRISHAGSHVKTNVRRLIVGRLLK
jgi:hypothetical protein